jgi:monoamine oxidase
MMGLCADLGLTLDELPLDTAGLRDDTFYFDGAVLSEAAIVTAFMPLAARMATAAAAGEDATEFARLDAMSIPAWLGDPNGGNLPPTALIRRILETAYVGEYGLEVAEQSVWNLLYLIDFDTPDPFHIFGDSDERFHIHEGSQAVPDGLAAQLTGRILLEHALTAIAVKSDGRPLLTFDTASGTVQVEADRVVLALPFTTLRRVDLAGAGLSDGKLAIIRELGYGTNAKLMMRFSSRPWRTGSNANGSSITDEGELQATWETSRGYAGADGILTNFVGGARGVAMGEGTAEERAAEVQPWLDAVFPGTSAAYVAGSAVRQHWPTAPFHLGSYACYKVGQAGFAGGEGEAEGAFHFCGEHTSIEAQGYMEGAAETGLRAATEVLAAFGLAPAARARRLLALAARRPLRSRRYRHRRGT